MTPEILTDSVVGVLGWTALVAVVQFMLLPVAVEAFRQRTFELRRELFNYMAEGNIRPDDPAYVRLRWLLNQLLRYAERVTFLRLVVMNCAYDPVVAPVEPLDHVIRQVKDERVRAHLRVFHARVSGAIMWHVIVTSPAAWVLSLIAIPAIALKRSISNIVELRRLLKWVPARVTPIRRFEDHADLLACA
jgi:hypothetical protein